MRRLAAFLLCALCGPVGGPAGAQSSPLVSVLPLTAREAALPESDRSLLFEMVRTGAADELNPQGFTVLATENTFELLRAQGVDPATLECEGNCALELSRKIGATLFISGSVTRTEGLLVVYLRLYEQRDGRQVSSARLEGASVRDLRRQFDEQKKEFFARGVARLDVDQRPLRALTRAAKKNDGFLNVTSDPVADVWVDGEALGRTPVRRYPLAPGSHLVLLSAPQRRSVSAQVQVNAGQEAQVTQALVPSSATLQLTVQPEGANVKLDGRRVTPGTVPTSAGRHRLEVDADGYAPATQEFSVEEEQTASVHLVLRARPVRVALSANLEGSCTVDGRTYKVERKPLVIELAPGTYTAACTRDRAAQVTRELVARAGEAASLLVEFRDVELGGSAQDERSGLWFLQLPPGMAQLGCAEDERCEAAAPRPHAERVEPFWLAATETPVAAFAACVAAGACSQEPLGRKGPLGECTGTTGRQRHPLNCVTQVEAEAFCAWTGGRLPTDSEWEYAARLAKPSRMATELNGCDRGCASRFHFPWAHSGSDDGFATTAPVGSYAPSGSKLLVDLLGNVAEWTSSNPDGSGRARVVRGGGWNSSLASLNAGAEAALPPLDWSEAVGFRCARQGP